MRSSSHFIGGVVFDSDKKRGQVGLDQHCHISDPRSKRPTTFQGILVLECKVLFLMSEPSLQARVLLHEIAMSSPKHFQLIAYLENGRVRMTKQTHRNG